MPITEELKTAQELRAAGAAPALAELLAAKFEAAAVAGRDAAFRDVLVELKGMRTDFSGEFKAFRADITAELKGFQADVDLRFAQMETRIAQVETRIAESRASQETSMRVLMAALIAAIGVGVAIIKLLPNLP